jgi:hypothetical protein
MPVCKPMAKTISGPDAASSIYKVSLTDDTISRPFSDMSRDMDVILREKRNDLRKKFSLQIYESADISGHARLITSIRYIDRNTVKQFIFLQGTSEWPTGNETSTVTNWIAMKDCWICLHPYVARNI